MSATKSSPAPQSLTQTPEFDIFAGAHKPFSWISEEAQCHPMADFATLTLDVCNGLNVCLEIAHNSDLERLNNADRAPGKEILPTTSIIDTSHLMRLAIASTTLIARLAEREIDSINKYGTKKSKANSGGAR